MPTPRLSQELHAKILQLRGQKLTYEQISAKTGASLGAISRIVNGLSEPADPLIIEQPVSKRDIANQTIDDNAAWHKEKFEHGLERLKKWIGDTNAAPERTASKTHSTRGRRAEPIISLVANDLHAPFMNESAFGQAIRESKAAGATRAIIPGDLMDLHSVSRYPKTRRGFSLVEEFQGARAVIRTLSENFDEVWLQEGNHDQRYFKLLVAHGIPPDVLDFLRLEYDNALSPLAKLAADFPNVKMLEVPKCGNAEYTHLAQVGDCVFSHSEKYSIIPVKATVDVLLFLKKKLEPMGVIKPFKVLIQAHTHQAGRVFGDFGVLCIENGTLAQIPDYDGNPKLMGREPILGYTLLTQTNGVSDINKTHFYRVG